jgi:hypothetical protein
VNARTRGLPLVLALTLASAGRAADTPATAPPAPLVPEYEVTLADGGRLKTLLSENAWAKELEASNLYRGALVRLGPLLSAVGRSEKDGWTGRLVDFVAERFLDKRPVRLSYFPAPGLVSPFGLTFPALSPAERSAAALVLKGLRSGPDVKRDVASGTGDVATVAVTPVALRLQRIAAVQTDTCLVLSRDPAVAATLSRSCTLEPRLAPATLDVRTDAFFSAWSAVLEKLFGVGPRLRVTFAWDKKRARFTPAGASLQLQKANALGTSALGAPLLAAIPADAPLLAAAVLPDPGGLDAASAEEYFRAAGRRGAGAAHVPVALVSLGMRAGTKDDKAQAMTVLLVPHAGDADAAVRDLDALFGGHRTFEVHASRACPGVVALSPSKAALARVADACAGRTPSLKQAPPAIVKTLTGGPVSAAAFLNLGGFLRDATLWGWQSEAPPPAKGQEPPPPPAEVADAMRLLERLPMYAFAGRSQGDAVLMTGAEP